MKKSRFEIIIFVSLLITSILGGYAINKNQTTYKSFFVEEKVAIAEPPQIPIVEEKININTNNLYELDSLDGIGESLAQRIIDYRKEHGDFEVIEDLMKVSGIGKKKFDAIKDKIYVKQ